MTGFHRKPCLDGHFFLCVMKRQIILGYPQSDIVIWALGSCITCSFTDLHSFPVATCSNGRKCWGVFRFQLQARWAPPQPRPRRPPRWLTGTTTVTTGTTSTTATTTLNHETWNCSVEVFLEWYLPSSKICVVVLVRNPQRDHADQHPSQHHYHR